MKDFTPKQANAWVAQELAKLTTPEKIAARIKSEQQMVKMGETSGLKNQLPNSHNAHETLLAKLLAL